MTSVLSRIEPAPVTVAGTDDYPNFPAGYQVREEAHDFMRGALPFWEDMSENLRNEYVRVYFMHGQCHALAMAVHEITPCTLVGEGWKDYDPSMPEHVFVQLPSGQGLDICGLFEQGSHPDPVAKDNWQTMTTEQVMELDYRTPDMDNARVYAKALVDWYIPRLQQAASQDSSLLAASR